ncbi:MAG: patatin-like phospholipase family protein [Burkholderiaceae bacterium]
MTKKPDFETVALVLQGGGALGSYQAGVVEGLVAADIEPDWLAGISIGAINTALIAGNPPATRVQRLREFWETICQPAMFAAPLQSLEQFVHGMPEARSALSALGAWRAMVEGQRDFFVTRGLTPWLGGKQGITEASFYDTSQLRGTLERFVDFDRINAGPTRVSVGAVNVRTGNFELFDNTTGSARKALRAEHFMASGALPPGFPAVEIDGEYYWDGGLVSNTPLALVLNAMPRRDTLVFQVDLWRAHGTLPDNVYDAEERRKDITYSSRTRAVTDMMARTQHLRRLLREVLEHVPARLQVSDRWCREAKELANTHQYNVIHLIYQDKAWEGLAKDYEFSHATMHEHWASGLNDIRHTLEHPEWLRRPPADVEFVTHDYHRLRQAESGG